MERRPKVALVHDWLTGMRGGEKCLEVFCELYPDATIFTLIHKKGSVSSTIENMDIRTSFLQRIPGIFDNYRNFLPLFPLAIGSFDLKGYDMILSSSHCVAKGAKRQKGSLHICYCFTPVRYAWKFFDQYFSHEKFLKKCMIRSVLSYLKKWDLASNKRVDNFVGISDNVKNRINSYYNREADVIYPPVDVDQLAVSSGDRGYYLVISALVPYKKIDLAVKAFNDSERDLVVIGTGPELEKLKKVSKSNIKFLGWGSDEDLKEYFAGCKALIFPGEEDFGIVPVEAQACGKPVMAYGAGGILETVIPLKEPSSGKKNENPTGIFFNEQTPEALNETIDEFEKNEQLFVPEKIARNASRFNRGRFKEEIRQYVESKWRELDHEG